MNKHKDAINLRQKINYEIVNELYRLIEENPTMRFGQILVNFILPDSNELCGDQIYESREMLSYIHSEEPAKTFARYYVNNASRELEKEHYRGKDD